MCEITQRAKRENEAQEVTAAADKSSKSKEVPPQGQTLQHTGQGLEGSIRLVLRRSLGTWQGRMCAQPADGKRHRQWAAQPAFQGDTWGSETVRK